MSDNIFEYLKGIDLGKGYRIADVCEGANSVYISGTDSAFNMKLPDILNDFRLDHKDIYEDIKKKFPEYFV